MKPQEDDTRKLYLDQNRKIHQARAQLCMDLEDVRALALEAFGKDSLRALDLRERWELIEDLKQKGARVRNPVLPDSIRFKRMASPKYKEPELSSEESPESVYPSLLEYWNKRFPRERPGFASNKQLASIQAFWQLDFNDGRAGPGLRGLRGFIYRQTKNLPDGPVSDLAFLRSHHVRAVLTPFRAKAKSMFIEKKERGLK